MNIASSDVIIEENTRIGLYQGNPRPSAKNSNKLDHRTTKNC